MSEWEVNGSYSTQLCYFYIFFRQQFCFSFPSIYTHDMANWYFVVSFFTYKFSICISDTVVVVFPWHSLNHTFLVTRKNWKSQAHSSLILAIHFTEFRWNCIFYVVCSELIFVYFSSFERCYTYSLLLLFNRNGNFAHKKYI